MKQSKTLRLAQLAMLAAIIIVLQQIVIPLPGGLTLSLVLVPIVVGAVLFGPASGAVLGGIFGAVVTFLVITGRAGEFSTMMWTAHPIMTVLVCMLKGIGAGFVAGLIAKAFKKHSFAVIVLASAAAPIVNTGIFLAGILTVFRDVIAEFAGKNGFGGTSVLYFAVVIIVGINFLVEFTANLVLSPTISSVVKAVRKTKN
ncbi:MAG: ECF transporter S component [Clostridia bacterium]|nr:ECF transporter S component [Clostridia bacterium]